MLLNNQHITEEIKKEIKICIETSENENTTTQNLQDSVKSSAKRRFTAIQAYLQKQEKHQTSSYLKQLEKEEMKNPKVSKRKEIVKIRVEINKKETKETIAKVSKTKSWFFEKIKQTNHQLDSSRKREKNQINKTRNENVEITTDNTEV